MSNQGLGTQKMTVLPIVMREMSVLARKRSTFIWRTVTASLAILVLGWVFLVSISGAAFAQLGTSIFIGLSGLAFLYALLAGIHATSDAVSEEKRDGTLGLLFLTDLRAYDVVLGKLAATSLNTIFAVLGLVPMISLAILLGGVTLLDIGVMAAVLANTLFLSLALGMFVSSISINERKALFAAILLLAVFSVGPFLATLVMTEFKSLPVKAVFLSPFYPILCVYKGSRGIPGFSHEFFYYAIVAHHLLAWVLLGAASICIRFSVRSAPSRKGNLLRDWIRTRVEGATEKRKEHRRRLLDRNAFMWLAAREPGKPAWAWAVVILFATLFAWATYGYGGILFDLHTSCIIVFLVHGIFKIWVVSEVTNRLLHDRRSGALELLLSSPLSVKEIAAGQQLALRRTFGGPVLALVVGEVGLMLLSLKMMSKPLPVDRALTFSAAIATLLLDLWALKWVALWLSLFGRSIERVLIGTVLRVLAGPWITFAVIATVLTAWFGLTGRTLEFREALYLWAGCGLVFPLWFGLRAKIGFLRHTREIAAAGFSRIEVPSKPLPTGSAPLRRWETMYGFLKRHPAFTCLAVMALALGAFVISRRIYWEAQLSEKVAALQRQDRPTKISELGRIYPRPLDADNGFKPISEAGMINRTALKGVSWGFDLSVASNFIHGVDRTNRLRAINILTNNPSQFAAFQKAVRMTNGFIDIFGDYRTSRFLDLYGYHNLALSDIVLALAERDGERVMKSVENSFGYARLLRSQPVPSAQAVALTSLWDTGRMLEGAFSQNILSDEDLARIWELIRAVDSPEVLERRLLVSSAKALDPPNGYEMDANELLRIRFMEFVGTKQQQLSSVLKLYESAFAKLKESSARQLAWANELNTFAYMADGGMPTIEMGHENAIREAFLIDIRTKAALAVLETAVAVQQYYRKHAAYPDSLGGLVPDYFPTIPLDPLTDAPLRWTGSSAKMVLYSVGLNRIDDGGATVASGYLGDIPFRFRRNDFRDQQSSR